MRKLLVIVAVILGVATTLVIAGCAPLRDQNGHPILDKKGNEEFHKAI